MMFIPGLSPGERLDRATSRPMVADSLFLRVAVFLPRILLGASICLFFGEPKKCSLEGWQARSNEAQNDLRTGPNDD